MVKQAIVASALLFAFTACDKFGDYVTAGGAPTGGAPVGAAAAGGAGGNGGDGDGANATCPGLTCEGECGSTELCATLEGETKYGNALCGEPAAGDSFPPDFTPDVDAFTVAGISSQGSAGPPIVVGTTRRTGSPEAFARPLPLPNAASEANALETNLSNTGNALGTGFVPPMPGDPDSTFGFLLGSWSGAGFGDASENQSYRGFAIRIDLPLDDAAPLTNFNAPPASASRFLAGTQTVGSSGHNDVLNVLALHASDFLDPKQSYDNEQKLSIVRFGDAGGTGNPSIVTELQKGCAFDADDFDPEHLYPAAADAPLGSEVVYFGATLCDDIVLGAWDGANNILMPWPVAIAPDEATVAGIHYLHREEESRVVVVGTFAGTLGFSQTDTVTSSGAHDVFIAVFDPTTGQAIHLENFGGSGDVRVSSVQVLQDQNGELVSVYVGGMLNGDISWRCINGGDQNDPTLRAFVARVDIPNTEAGPMVPLYVKVYGGGANDSRVRGLALDGGHVWVAGDGQGASTIQTHPSGAPIGGALTVPDGGLSFAFRFDRDQAFEP